MLSWSALVVVLAEYLVLLLPAVLVWLWLTDARETAFFACVTVVVSIVVSYALGMIYAHPAPYTTAATLVTGPPENSFPSQHTTVMFAMVWPLALRRRYWLVGIFLAGGILTGSMRVVVGFHYPIDVLGGVVASGIGIVLVSVADEYVAKLGRWFIVADDHIRSVF